MNDAAPRTVVLLRRWSARAVALALAAPLAGVCGPGQGLDRPPDSASSGDAARAPLSPQSLPIHLASAVSGPSLDVGADGSTRALTAEIMAHLRAREFDSALVLASRLARAAPGSPAGYNFQGMAYLGRRDLTNAALAFERALTADPLDETALLNLAELDIRRSNPSKARQRYEAVLARAANNPMALLGMAKASLAERDRAAAIRWLERLRDADPRSLRSRLLLTEQLLENNETARAVAELGRVPAAQADQPAVLELLGRAQIASGKATAAVATYSRLVSLKPEVARAHFLKAGAQALAGDTEGAATSYRNALKLQPGNLEALSALAWLEMRASRYDEAIKIAEQAKKTAPKSSVGFTLQAEAHFARRQFAPALGAFEKAWTLEQSSLLAVRMFSARMALGKGNEAERELRAWIAARPRDVAARMYLAGHYASTDRGEEAIKQYQQVIRDDPNNATALNNLANLYLTSGDANAKATAEAAYRLLPEAPVVMDTLGWVLVQTGDVARGLELLANAARKSPEMPEISYHYAVALAKSGDKARARQELQRLLDTNASFRQRDEAEALLKTL